ncbi:hypothetical protein [Arthrobacter sp. ISL-72]|uniref:hypothetical protein n=1 Tax=Arthrobacter sp. ISL-72 TaxID=2819114 RepID=UPI001BE6689D|nr:hypothetical protein [Arthrobacter sp. ISL-72]MBT2594750.1 hypothetical protein [Arthrobacter sp. ISL-72]
MTDRINDTYEVTELGEDGDMWIVQRSATYFGGDESSARLAVIEYLRQCHGDDDETFGSSVHLALDAQVHKGNHWHWHVATPDHDPELMLLDCDSVTHETFTGWLFGGSAPSVRTREEVPATVAA